MHFFIPARLGRQVGVLVGMEAVSSPTLSLIIVYGVRYKSKSWWVASAPLYEPDRKIFLDFILGYEEDERKH